MLSLLFLMLFLILVVGGMFSPFVLAAATPVWPLPVTTTSSGRRRFFTHPKNLRFVADAQYNSILGPAFTRYRALLLNAYPSALTDDNPEMATFLTASLTASAISTITVTVASTDQSLGLHTSEAYTLRIGPQVTINASTVFAALRALETLSQLAQSLTVDNASILTKVKAGTAFANALIAVTSTVKRLIVIDEATITDAPRFRHRGLMIDTARNFLPMSIIKAHLDGMAAAKLNVLHWHMTDDESFTYFSAVLPELAQKGAFSPTSMYSAATIATLVSYARARGIRIVPEFDTPDHTTSWSKSHPEIFTSCEWSKTLDPSNEATYALLKKLFTEVAGRFPDAYLHLGGDELDFGCWTHDPNVAQWMANKGFDGPAALAYYFQRLVNITSGLGKKVTVWQEVLDSPGGAAVLPRDTMVQVWRWAANLGGDYFVNMDNSFWLAELEKVTAAGKLAVLSAPWYLSAAPAEDTAVWRQFWKVEPHNFAGDLNQKERVIGGTSCVWGERIGANNALPRTWPLAAVIGERLWSSASVVDEAAAGPRLAQFRCLLRWRGIPASAVDAGSCPSAVEAKATI